MQRILTLKISDSTIKYSLCPGDWISNFYLSWVAEICTKKEKMSEISQINKVEISRIWHKILWFRTMFTKRPSQKFKNSRSSTKLLRKYRKTRYLPNLIWGRFRDRSIWRGKFLINRVVGRVTPPVLWLLSIPDYTSNTQKSQKSSRSSSFCSAITWMRVAMVAGPSSTAYSPSRHTWSLISAPRTMAIRMTISALILRVVIPWPRLQKPIISHLCKMEKATPSVKSIYRGKYFTMGLWL